MKRNRQPRKTKWLLVVAFLVLAAIVGTIVAQKYKVSSRPQTPISPEPAGLTKVTLFFADAGGEGLVREGREVEIEDDLAGSVETVIDELISGPVGDHEPVLPHNTQIRGVEVNGDEAVIDLGREVIDSLPGGSSSEMTAVYAVIDTIAVNFPQIKKVRFLIEGEKVKTLRGHLDLSQSLAADFSQEKKP